jgi:hypothetical protein
MRKGTLIGLVLLIVLMTVGGARKSIASDIDGAWLSDAGYCQKVFEKKGGLVSFAPGLGTFGNGFIVEGNQIRGRIAKCTIRASRQQGTIVNLIAVCSTDIAIDTIHFRLRIEGPNRIVREFVGMPDMEIPYERCAL